MLVPLRVCVTVPELDDVALEVIVDESVTVGETLALNDVEGVLLALPPSDNVAVGDAETEFERLVVVDSRSLVVCVCEGEFDDVGVPDDVEVNVPVPVALELVVTELVSELELVIDELAPLVSDAVGVFEFDFDKLCVDDGDCDEVGVPLLVLVALVVAVELSLKVFDAVPDVMIGVSLEVGLGDLDDKGVVVGVTVARF